MRVWKAVEPPKDIDSRVYNILKRLNEGASQTQVAVKNITNNITNLGTSPDLTNYFYLPGRPGGQIGFGASLTSDPGSVARLTLQAYNNFTGSVSARSSRLEMSNDIALRCDSLYIVERDLTYAGIDGFQFLTGAGFGSQLNVFGGAIRLLANSPGGSPQLVIDNTGTGSSAAAKLLQIKAKSTQNSTGNLTEWLSSAGAIMSKIQFDGTFVGPIASLSTASFVDSLFSVVDDGDNSKVLQFQVSGVTTATTRTLTVPDVSATILTTQGTSIGQVIGTTAHTGGSASSLVVEGPLLIGDNLVGINFVSGTALDIRQNAVNNGIGITFLYNLQTLSGAASGSLVLQSVNTSGAMAYTSGTASLIGLRFQPALTIPSGVTITPLIGVLSDLNFGTTAGGTVTDWNCFRGIQRGAASGGPALTNVVTYYASPGWRAGSPSIVAAFGAIKSSSSFYGGGTAANAVAFEVDSTFCASSAVTTWSGLRIPTISGPGTIWGLNITGSMNNRIGGMLTVGGTTTPTNTTILTAGSRPAIGTLAAGIRGIETLQATADNDTIVGFMADHTYDPNSKAGVKGIAIWVPDVFLGGTGTLAEKWGLYSTNANVHSSIVGLLALGSTTIPSHRLDISAGTTTIAPIRFASGTNLTAAVSGAFEFDGTRLYITNSVPARKTIAYTDDIPAVSTIATQTEIDFGTTPVAEASFTVTDANVTAGSQITGSVSYEAPTGKDLDELDMDGLDLKFGPGSGQLTIYARAMDDALVADKFKINYVVG